MQCLRCGKPVGKNLRLCQKCQSLQSIKNRIASDRWEEHETVEAYERRSPSDRVNDLVLALRNLSPGTKFAILGLILFASIVIPMLRSPSGRRGLDMFMASQGGVQTIAKQCRERFPQKIAFCENFRVRCDRPTPDSDCEKTLAALKKIVLGAPDPHDPFALGGRYAMPTQGEIAAFAGGNAAPAVDRLKRSLSLPKQIDDRTMLVDVHSLDARTVEYLVDVVPPSEGLGSTFMADMRTVHWALTCGDKSSLAILKSGLEKKITLRTKATGAAIGTIVFQATDCA